MIKISDNDEFHGLVSPAKNFSLRIATVIHAIIVLYIVESFSCHHPIK